MKAEFVLIFIVWIMVLLLLIYVLLKKNYVAKQNQENNASIEYNTYEMNFKEAIVYFITAAVVIVFTAYVLYRDIIICSVVIPFAIFYVREKKKEIINSRKIELNNQFKDALYAISSSLNSGKAVETSIKDALKDLKIMYPDQEAFIIKEFELINKKVEMNETIESALENFSVRADLDDIRSFVDVFKICKRTGGNIIQAIRNTSDIISDKIIVKQEIYALLAQRRFERKLLNFLPIGLIFLMNSTSPEFMEPIYTQAGGKIAMTAAVILLLFAFFISKKIMDIEV